MADRFTADLRDFERVVARLGELQEEMRSLAAERDVLRRKLRSSATVAQDLPDVEPSAIREVVDAVKGLGGGARVPQIAKALQISERAANNRLLRATDLKLLERTSRGRYRLRDKDLATTASADETPQDEGAEDLAESPQAEV
jgi:hypothetical protein